MLNYKWNILSNLSTQISGPKDAPKMTSQVLLRFLWIFPQFPFLNIFLTPYLSLRVISQRYLILSTEIEKIIHFVTRSTIAMF
jgi:hypothetical protein